MCFHFRPKKESTGELSESGASVVKYGLKAEKIFMQVHYLKVSVVSWFLLKLLYEYHNEFCLLDISKFIASALIFCRVIFFYDLWQGQLERSHTLHLYGNLSLSSMGSSSFLRYCAWACSSPFGKTNDPNFWIGYLNHHFWLWCKGRGNCNSSI